MLPGLRVIATPGHTEGHQCVLVRGDDDALDVLIGDAAYTSGAIPRSGPPRRCRPPGRPGQRRAAWRASLRRIRSLGPDRVHFCHHTHVYHR